MSVFEISSTIPLNSRSITITISEQQNEADESRQQELRALLDKTITILLSEGQMRTEPCDKIPSCLQGQHIFFPFQKEKVIPITKKQIALLRKFLRKLSIPEQEFCKTYALSDLTKMGKDDAWWIIRRLGNMNH